MKNLNSSGVPYFIFLLTFSLSAVASDIAVSLQGVANLQHPTSTRYTAGQPEPEAFAAFAKAGVAHVINLRPPQETPGLNEAALVTQAGMAYYNIPVDGAADLTAEKVRRLDALLEKIGQEKVLIHCSSGNRVGAMMALRAAWLQQAPVEKALEEGRNYGLTRMLPEVKDLLTQQPGM